MENFITDITIDGVSYEAFHKIAMLTEKKYHKQIYVNYTGTSTGELTIHNNNMPKNRALFAMYIKEVTDIITE